MTNSVPLDLAVQHFLEAEQHRVLLIANNPRLSREGLRGLVTSDGDILVQFNKAAFFDVFAETKCHKVHVFNGTSWDQHWGISMEGIPDQNYTEQQASSLTLLFSYWISSPSRRYMDSLDSAVKCATVDPRRDFPGFAYPGLACAEKLWPTIGFVAALLFRHINQCRLAAGAPSLPITLVGFDGVYPDKKAWTGHDWQFGQAAYAEAPDLTRIHV